MLRIRNLMREKQVLYPKRADYFINHPVLRWEMRAKLLTWLAQVVNAYKLHREIYYLAVDFIDRYLSVCKHVPKNELQLVGITCLFMATKIDEDLCMPRSSDFSHVTDGACTVDQIIGKEGDIAEALDWRLFPITANSWLNFYLQLDGVEKSNEFTGFCPLTFVEAARILDLCVLDISSLNFTASTLAASVLAYTKSPKLAVRVSGSSMKSLLNCFNWIVSNFENTKLYRPFSSSFNGGASGGDGGGDSAFPFHSYGIWLEQREAIKTPVV